MAEPGRALGVVTVEPDYISSLAIERFRHLQFKFCRLGPGCRIGAYDCSHPRALQVDGPARLARYGVLMCFDIHLAFFHRKLAVLKM